MSISAERVEKAIDFLAQTDSEIAKLEAEVYALEKTEKIILAEEEKKSGAKTKGERETDARLSRQYSDWLEIMQVKLEAFNKIKNRRITAHAIISGYKAQTFHMNLGNV